ncbi:MAG: ABC transporter ATP-binding protein [Firmicutes bacterium]|nr:ABC transporter ATP-binding protein [Bacillota bacterium]
MIHVQNLTYSYQRDGRFAVNNISFEIGKGEIFGFLGPSGAGKSTTQNLLTGQLLMQSGEAEVDGYNLRRENKKRFNRIGMSFEQSNLYSKLTAEENLRYYARLFDVPTRDPRELIQMVGLGGKENRKAGSFSKGQKHRLTFARSLINNPAMWFLDEPTTGLDPAIAAQIKDIIRKECATGVTAFLTTHNMFIADELCDRVAFIVDGEIKLIDSPKTLKLQYGHKTVAVEYKQDGDVKKETLAPAKEDDKARLHEILDKAEIITMHSREATLEEIFIKVTGKGLTADETVG